MGPNSDRHVLIVAHTGRDDSLEAAVTVCRQLQAAGVIPVLNADEYDDLLRYAPDLAPVAVLQERIVQESVLRESVLQESALEESALEESVLEESKPGGTPLGDRVSIGDLEIVIVLGGDGTILRAAELTRGCGAPLLGVNLGHVGFLAESEREDLTAAIARVLARDYEVEERMTLNVRVKVDSQVVYETWALNEATVEKASRERMLEVVIEVDGRPLSSFGCDGVVMSTPTGSTAYSFSAGGPVVWPSVDAMLLVPLSPHALFARPLVVGPQSSLAVEVLDRTQGTGVLWCDGRRTHDLPRGARVVVRRSPIPVRLARLSNGAFTDRLVHKFNLPVAGWRGEGTRA
jgi:NAD+ kinase